jgi:quercetin dioxygenase-like cupin family protein
MIVMKAADVENAKVPSVNYKDKTLPVKGVGIRWLSKVGLDEQGVPEYGLRLFTVEPGGEIPVHSHFYMQTLYILSGRFDCRQFDPETDEIVDSRICGPHDLVYVPSMEPHGMINVSSAEEGTFLCCICSLYK